jgi:GntR family transcriptional regulator
VTPPPGTPGLRIVLSSSSGVPMYEQIKTAVRGAVHSGELPPGTMLPSLRQLAAELRVSMVTITRAYNDLVAEGVVANEHGRGFAVLPVDPDVALTALVERVDTAVQDVVRAARAARLTREDLDSRIDDEWRR